MADLTPKQVVDALDKYIIGQADAKRAVALAIRGRWRRQKLPSSIRSDVAPKNILMAGPTGVGKTEIARRLASLTGAPFIKVEATKYTEVGYHGRDVESMIRDLLDVAINLIRDEMAETVRESAASQVRERLLDLLLPMPPMLARGVEDGDALERHQRTREKLGAQLDAGELEDRPVEFSVEEKGSAMSMLGEMALDMDPQMQNMFERMIPSRRETRRMTVADARKSLGGQEAEKLLDKNKILAAAIERTEEAGIIFLDEIDKVCGSEKSDGPDVSRQGVQRDLLPIVEGSTVTTKHGPVKTDHILFIAAGAFHNSKPADLMPELQGRFPIRVELQDLSRDDFVRILREPKNALVKQQIELLKTEGIDLQFTDDAILSLAQTAFDLNLKTQNLGARRLYTIMEKVLETVSYEAPDMIEKKFVIDAAYVRSKLAPLMKKESKGIFGL